jgi:hypothetical protein
MKEMDTAVFQGSLAISARLCIIMGALGLGVQPTDEWYQANLQILFMTVTWLPIIWLIAFTIASALPAESRIIFL